jgi:hypothetical protein
MLQGLCGDHNIEPPEMTLTFPNEMERDRFMHALRQEFSMLLPFLEPSLGLSMVPVGGIRMDTCYGIKFFLSAKSPR